MHSFRNKRKANPVEYSLAWLTWIYSFFFFTVWQIQWCKLTNMKQFSCRSRKRKKRERKIPCAYIELKEIVESCGYMFTCQSDIKMWVVCEKNVLLSLSLFLFYSIRYFFSSIDQSTAVTAAESQAGEGDSSHLTNSPLICNTHTHSGIFIEHLSYFSILLSLSTLYRTRDWLVCLCVLYQVAWERF